MAIDLKHELTKALITIARTKMFYSHIIQQFEKVFTSGDNAKVPTAAVGRIPGERYIKLYYNEDYCTKLVTNAKNKEQAHDLLIGLNEHEMLHVLLGHLFLDFPERERGNVACDLTVNPFLESKCRHESWLMPELFSMPDGKSSMWYYQNLKNNPKFNAMQKAGAFKKGGSHSINHDMWGDLTKDLLAKEFAKDLVRKAKDLCSNSYGNVPAGLIEQIENAMRRDKPIVPWNQVLRQFCASATESVLESTMKRISKRFGTRPGTKKEDVLNIVVAVDTSGSISTENLKTFFDEIRWICRNGAVVTIIEADAAVARTYKFRGKWDGTVHGRGGTDLEPALKEAEGNYDALIYFTDFEAPRITKRYNIPTLWVLTSDMDKSEFPYPWGKHIRITNNVASAA